MPSYGGAPNMLRLSKGEPTLDEFKKELVGALRTQNLPRRLRQLKQTGTIRDYVQAFSACMLDIKDMSDKDRLFHFITGLAPWAQKELFRGFRICHQLKQRPSG